MAVGSPDWAGAASSGRPAAGRGDVARPEIIGVAHIAVRSSSLEGAREFYGHVLGYQEPYVMQNPGGGTPFACFKVNDHQYIEVLPVLEGPTEDRLLNIAFETKNARELRRYLASRRVTVPESLAPDLNGNLSFMVQDPDGHAVGFVEYRPGSLEERNFGKFLPATRISQHMIHVGFTIRDRAAADRFYRDILGFKLMWYGGMKDTQVEWVDMRVPEGTDWLEYMTNVRDLSPRTLGVLHHMALGVPDIHAAAQTAIDRGYKRGKPEIGRDGKWQLGLFDADGTRAELMEFKPVQTPCCSPMIEP